MRHPPKPPLECGVLLPKIAARQRLSLPCFHTDLCLTSLPCDTQPPCRLQSVRVCGQTVIQPGCTPSTIILRIPLHVQLCDACGKMYSACTDAEVETCAPRSMERCSYHMMWTAPEVRLLECACGEECFHVKLSICAELYLLRLEPCMTHPPRPTCPQLPLYPPPMH